jgi:hypothetical protein
MIEQKQLKNIENFTHQLFVVAAKIKKYDDHSYSYEYIPTLVWIPPPKQKQRHPCLLCFYGCCQTNVFMVAESAPN